MNNSKLAGMIEKEQENLDKLKKKRADLDEKIRKSEAKLQEYEMMNNSRKFDMLQGVVKGTGLSMDDIMLALQNGDFLSLQEQMEAKEKEEEVTTTTTDTETREIWHE